MSELSEIAAKLAALSDDELVAVLHAATAGRTAFWAVNSALGEMAAVHHAELVDDVSPATAPSPTHDSPGAGGVSGQVGSGFTVPVVPGQPTGMPGRPGIGGYSSAGVPTFESVRDKVEQRFGTAQGMGELDRQTPAGRSADEQWEAREKAARERLDRIRKSLHGNDTDNS
ncbi:hypothetical protein [Nocardia sp. NPDC052566]|uniref:hypothetical protein n=1 Tax=Nocardia sp. NPDC052566 TaxID=3364330 RepID=UPI0037C51213